MAGFEGLGAGFLLLLFLGRITCTDIVKVSSRPICALTSLQDSFLGSQAYGCPVGEIGSFYVSGAIEVCLWFLIFFLTVGFSYYFISEVIYYP